jgi:hypothetical protein
MDDRSVVAIESGRLVIIPKRSLPRGPMRGSCVILPVPAGRFVLTPYYLPVSGHPGTAALKRLVISKGSGSDSVSDQILLAHAPFLLLGDHSFVYTRTPGAMSEPGRALRACAGARRSGTYRADSSDVGACLRTGWRKAAYAVRQLDGGTIECDLLECEDDEDDDFTQPQRLIRAGSFEPSSIQPRCRDRSHSRLATGDRSG